MRNFQTPHCHIASLDSASSVEAFVERELELETGTLTVTDHGFLGECIQVYQKAKKNGLTPILGIEAYHRDDNCSILTNAGILKDKDGTFKDFYKYGHITLHAKNQKAYEALVKKVSDADLTAEQHGSERKPIFNWQVLEQLGAYDVIGTSGCLIGTVGRMLMRDRLDLAEQYYERARSCFKAGNFYVEIMPHRCDKNWINGCFLYLENGEILKFYPGKKVKTDIFPEITVSDLAKASKKGKLGKLLAVKNYSTWVEEPKSLEIIKCEFVQDFVPNECKPWADDGDLQKGLNQFLINLANKYNDKIIISDDSHYAKPEEAIIQNIKLGGMGDSFKFQPGYYRQSSQEAFDYFHTYMGMNQKTFEGYVDNNYEWAANFKDFNLEYKPSLPISFYPENTLKHVLELIKKHDRMDWKNPVMVERLKQEINLLHDNGTIDLLPYFFLAEECVNEYRKHGENTGVGRGSAAGVLLTYLLNITHANPLQYDLSLDRFLTLDRIKTGKLPDIDQDLPSRHLLEGPDGLFERRFKGHYAQVSTRNKLRLKLALKDLSRAIWGEVTKEVEDLCKSIPNPPQGIEDDSFIFGYESDDGNVVQGLFETHEGLQKFAQKYPEHWKSVIGLCGLSRSHGRHAAAYIIADKPIDSFIPLMTVNGVRTTQYTKDDCEFVGGVKMDYLTLNTLIDLNNAVKLIQERAQIQIPTKAVINGTSVDKLQIIPKDDNFLDIWNLPNDSEVFEDICQGKTETVFQLCTPGALKWLREFNYEKSDGTGKLINDVRDISAFTALDRPGPLDAIISNDYVKRNMLQEFAARARGETALDSIEFLDRSLPETYGVITYQEQLTKIFQDLSGCDGIKANEFRNKISKKKMEEVLAYYPMYIENASKIIGKEQADKVWKQLYTFGQYGFNKSHSLSYGLTAYTCAYLKHYFPLEWWCAVLQNADKNEVAEKFWLYCNNFVSLPDIKYPVDNFKIIDNKIIAPLSLLQGVGEGAHDELVRGAPYIDIEDFCKRIINTKETKSKFTEDGKKRIGRSSLHDGIVNKLIVSGVLDSLFPGNLSITAKLERYQKTLADLTGKKQKKIPEEYTTLNPLKIYQYRKNILPIYSRSLRSLLSKLGKYGISESVEQRFGKTFTEYHYNPQDPELVDYINRVLNIKKFPYGLYKLLGGHELMGANESQTIIGPDRQSFKCAAVGYVVKAERFKFSNRTKEAYKVLIEVEGQLFEFVQWPNYRTNKLIAPEKDLTGSISLLLLERYSNEKPFNIQCIVEIEKPSED